MEFETGNSPDYDEVMERFGDQVNLQRAIEKTHQVQEEYPFVAMGSILGSKQIYGAEDLRTTSKGLDFIAPSVEIEKALEESKETWQYDQALVYVDDTDEDEWMIATIPFDCCAFPDKKQSDFKFSYEDWKDSRIVRTEEEDIEAVPPEAGYMSKFRRYLMQKENRGRYKKGDVIDMASIALRDFRGESSISIPKLAEYRERYTNRQIGIEEIKQDFSKTLLNEDLEAEISSEDIEGILEQVDQWHR